KEAVAEPGVVVLSSTDTPLALVIRSGLPSPLTSATATNTELEAPGVAKSCVGAKVGVVAPGAVVLRNTDTLLEIRLATATSGLPSPLKSPIATDLGLVPVAKSW